MLTAQRNSSVMAGSSKISFRGTPAAKVRHYFALGVLSIGIACGLALHYSHVMDNVAARVAEADRELEQSVEEHFRKRHFFDPLVNLKTAARARLIHEGKDTDKDLTFNTD